MNIQKIAVIMVWVLSSLAASGVSPSKTELEGMYDKAFREFDANNYEQALTDLDAIDARQPDLAESQNLRGVIMMRQGEYDKGEAALHKALAADPKFWNARFNLAEIPFLQKKWPEARKRFQELLSGDASELQGEARQLIQYKILLTHLMEGKENMVQSMIAKFELTPEMPAVHYANAAIALNKKDELEAKEWLTRAEKAFSPQLNKLFTESLYTIGWLEKPAGQARAALELSSAAERAAQTKAFARAKFEEAEQALQQRDFTAARKLVEEAEAADPNQAAVINLRGEILLEQKEYDEAEREFQRAAKTDPKFRDAQYNLARVPFRKKEYTKARERFEALFSNTSGADKDRAAQLLKYKVYLTYLLEGKDARAQKMMEQFQFTGDTPALYYAQAAWEFKNNNPVKANEWVTSARKIYPAALNTVFADAFYDLGWLQSTAAEPAAATVAEATPQEVAPEGAAAPEVEPTPIPAVTLAQNDRVQLSDPLTLAAQPEVPGMEATTADAEELPAASTMVEAAASPSVETPVAATSSPAAAQPVPAGPSPAALEDEAGATAVSAAATPVTSLAPAKVREWSQPTVTERFEQLGGANPVLWAVMLLAGVLLLSYVVIPEMRRRLFKTSGQRLAAPATETSFEPEAAPVGALDQLVGPTRLAGGPPQVSLQLRASEPGLRRAVLPGGKAARPYGNGLVGGNGNSYSKGKGNGHGNGHHHATAGVAAPVPVMAEPEPFVAPETESFEKGVGEAVTAVAEVVTMEPAPAKEWFEPAVAAETAGPQPIAPVFTPAPACSAAPAFVADPVFAAPPVAAEAEVVPVASAETSTSFEGSGEAIAFVGVEESKSFASATAEDVIAPAPVSEPMAAMAPEEPDEAVSEPIGEGQPIPYLTAATSGEKPMASAVESEPAEPAAAAPLAAAAGLAGGEALRHSVSRTSPPSEAVSAQPIAQQPNQQVPMPQPTQSIPAPAIRGPQPGGAAPLPAAPGLLPAMAGLQPQRELGQPSGATEGMQTAVQLTFPFEIASLQLTPSFKMGTLQLRPTSKIVTMRLAPSQQPQPAMNLQVTFEIASVQLSGNGIGMIRLTPSQQQRPSMISTPSFNIAGLQLVSGSDAAPVQLTPSQQGQASVLVTAGFQIASVEFSPSFEIASIILNATSRTANVQLPGTGPSAVEGAPVFDISNVQLDGNGEISMMQLNPPGTAKRA